MTDDLDREIEEIAKLLPAKPQGLTELRSLIASLPAPSPLALPDVSSTSLPTSEQQTAEITGGSPVSTGGGSTGATAPVLPTGTISGTQIAPGTLSANAFAPSIRPIQLVEGPDLPTLPNANFPVGSVIYNLSDGRLYRNDTDVWRTPFPERGRNLVADPAFETVSYGVQLSADPTAYGRTSSVDGWTVTLSRLAGSGVVTYYWDDVYDRASDSSTFNSSLIDFAFYIPVGTTEAKVEAQSAWSGANYSTDLAYVVGSIKFLVWDMSATLSEATLTVEVLMRKNQVVTVEAFQTVNLLSLDTDVPYELFTAAVRDLGAFTGYAVRYRFYAKRATGTGDLYPSLPIAEPQLHFAGTPDPGNFSPDISRWVPTSVAAHDTILGASIPWTDPSYSPKMELTKESLSFREFVTDYWPSFSAQRPGSIYWGKGAYVADNIYFTTRLWLRDKAWMIFGANKVWPWPEQDEWKLEIIGSLYDDGSPLRQIGWAPYAYPIGFDPAGTYTTALSLAANGGCIAIPIHVPAKMILASVSIWNTDTASARSWNWHLYAQQAGNASNTLDRVAAGSADDSWTASVASKRTITNGTAVILSPGTYWLVVQNTHATSTFGLGSVASGTLSHDRAQTKTLTVPVGSTLDFVAATWTKVTGIYAAVLEGKVFGQTQPVELPLLHRLNTPVLYRPTITRL